MSFTPKTPNTNFGSGIDTELNNLSASIASIISAIEDLRRSDGALKNGLVTRDSFGASLLELFQDAVTASDALQSVDLDASGGSVAKTLPEWLVAVDPTSAGFQTAFASILMAAFANAPLLPASDPVSPGIYRNGNGLTIVVS
jgi:hypothetical protein